jgi:hypothetical protein
MYCSSCGVSIAQGLSYCNYCGAKQNRSESLIKSSELSPERLIQTMGAVFVCGLLAITVFLGVMKAVLGFNLGQILFFAVLSFLMMIVIEGVLIKLLLLGRRGAERSNETLPSGGPKTRELDAAEARGLPEPLPSVTEHTTRTFEPIFTHRTSK